MIWVLQPRVKDPHYRLITFFCTRTMDFMSPPTFDILNIQIWKVKMSLYLKALGIHVYLVTTNNAYCLNGKNLEANAKALHALMSTLNNEYLSRVSNIDSTFVAWNIITSLGEKDLYYAGSDSDVGSDTSKHVLHGPRG